ncbi:hypothetical protein [Nocardia lijiangensis]|uniref:hypothetical protein n=1 Tax=Nocardia lijiangensis TaxID=299618 RepID=UPI000A41FAD6|nr:hypothetical protein [Nocardia lijiangensis]
MTVDDALSLLADEQPAAWSQQQDGTWQMVFVDGRLSDPLPDHVVEALRITRVVMGR